MRNFFIKTIVSGICMLTFLSSVNAQKNAYVVFADGKKILTEDFELEKTADGTVMLTSVVGGSKILTVEKNFRPQSFSIEQQNAKVLSVEFADGKAKIASSGKSEISISSKADAVLENNVWSQYILLLARYDAAKTSKQNFKFLLPSLALELDLSLQKKGGQTLSLNGKPVKIDSYEIETSGLKVKVAADENKFPLLIEIPSQKVKVVRQDFEAAADKLSSLEKKVFNGEFSSEEVSFPNNGITLGGTLTLPKNGKKNFPAAILITGSGTQDRDGKDAGFIYKNIAESLSKAGVAVLRVDDRGIGKSQITKEQAATTSYFDLIGDTRAAIDFLSKRSEIEQTKITLVGHSEGVGTALYLAANDKRVAAVALLAGISFSLDKAILEQSLYQAATGETVETATRENSQIVRFLMKMFADAKLPENADNPKFAYFREHLNFNPLELTQKIKTPVLILQGERDVQVLAYHAIRLADSLNAGGNKNVSLRIIPNVGHLFTSAEDPKTNEETLYDLQIWAEKILLTSQK